MDNWRELPAGYKLNKVVAERLGWKLLDGDLFDPDGHEVAPKKANLWSIWEIAPDYSTDASVHLPLNEGEEFEIHEFWNGICVARVRQPLTGSNGEWLEDTTLAEARCRAWLAWQDRNK